MTDRDLWCFVTKYRQLLSAGKTAKLVMESHLGCARVNLELFLNAADDHLQEHEQQRHQGRVHRIAGVEARVRRRARRAQAREAAAAQVQSRSPDVSPPSPPPTNIVEDAAEQDPGPAVSAVPHPHPHLSLHSPQQTAAVDAVLYNPLDPAEGAVPRHLHPHQGEEVLLNAPPHDRHIYRRHYLQLPSPVRLVSCSLA